MQYEIVLLSIINNMLLHMKKIISAMLLTVVIFSNAQTENFGIIGTENWMENWTNFRPKSTIFKDPNIILSGEISQNITLEKKNTYLIMGALYLTNNAILNIEAGTVIRGDYETIGTLIICKGSKIIANGTATDPIIFTSIKGASERNAGDWGGIIILGGAPINKLGGFAVLDFNLDSKYAVYGGNDDQNDSGILKYVRIEFSGKKMKDGKDLNGLSLAGIGANTTIDHVQISFSNDDSFQFYGGNVKLSNLISFKATDDDFDFTQGVQCDIKNSIALRYPFYSDISKSRCFEIESYDKVDNTDFSKKMTLVNATNMSFVNVEENNQGLINEAIYLKQNALLNVTNTLISGFSSAVLFDMKPGDKIDYLKKLEFKNLLFNKCDENFMAQLKTDIPEISNYFATTNYTIENSQKTLLELFIETDLKKNVDFRKKSNIILTTR